MVEITRFFSENKMSPTAALLAALCLAAASDAAKLLSRQERDQPAPPPAYRPAAPAPQAYKSAPPQAYKVEAPLKDLDGDGYADDKVHIEPESLLPINYKFAYNVEDGEIGNYQTRKEVRDGLETYGEYSYIDPSGVLRTVKYTSHPIRGYEAKEYEQQTDIIPKPPTNKYDTYGRLLPAAGADGYAKQQAYRQ